MHVQGRTKEGINEDQGAPRRIQGYTRRLFGGNQRTCREIDDLENKIGVFMRNPVPKAEVDECTCPDNYIIIDDTDSEPSEDEWIDEAGADIMESSTDQNF